MTNEKLESYLNGIFAPYEGVKSVAELKADLFSDLEERLRELKAGGKDDETAFRTTIESIGDIEETIREAAHLSRSLERQVLVHFNASDLVGSDFAGVVAHDRKFHASALRDADFSRADLRGSSFATCDMRRTRFDDADLTECVLSVSDLTEANFARALLVRTVFEKSALNRATFQDVKLTDVRFSMTDLREAVFENCLFNGVVFNSDLSGLCLDGQTFVGVRFEKAGLTNLSLKGATLKNVSFTPPFSFTNKYYKAIKTIHFDEATMDKLTYASLKGMGAELSKVVVI